MNEKLLINNLYKEFPIFYDICDPIIGMENNVYHIYGNFGLFFSDLITLYIVKKIDYREYHGDFELSQLYDASMLEIEIKKVFNFINKMYLNESNIDILNTCIFEAILGNDYSYNLARKFLSKNAYNHYLNICKRTL